MVRAASSRVAMRAAVTAVAAAAALVAAGGLAAAVPGADTDRTAHRIGTAPQAPAGAVAAGTPADSTPLHLNINLAPRDPAALSAFVSAVNTPGSPAYHHYLAKGEFAARFGATAGTVTAVRASLRGAGLTPGALSSDGLSLGVDTTVGQARTSLSTGFTKYRLADGTSGVLNTAAPQLRGSVAAQVASITGLNSTARAVAQHTVRKPAATVRSRAAVTAPRAQATGGGPALCAGAVGDLAGFGSDGDGWYSAQSLADAYQLEHTPTSGSGSTVAFYELENFSTADFAAYQKCYGTHAALQVIKVGNVGRQAAPGNGVGAETLLDIETVAGLAPGAKLLVYQGADADQVTDAQAEDVYRRMVTDDNAQVISTSWGLCEPVANHYGISATENYLFQEAAAQGQTVVAASGDDGATGCLAAKSTGEYVIDPASLPTVTAVGGTSLQGNPVTSRTTWNLGSSGSSGGGISRNARLTASFQAGVRAPGYANLCGTTGSSPCRQVPDVAALADQKTGYPVYVDGEWMVMGGTSGAAPVWAALTAIANRTAACRATGPLGFLNYTLYRNAGKGGFTDITTGTNNIGHGGYKAAVGYDLTTGLGEPVAATLIPQLCAATSAQNTAAGTYHPIRFARVLDTRANKGARVPSGGFRTVRIAGNTALHTPSSGVSAVVLNVVATSTTGTGYVTAWADGKPRPRTPSLWWSGSNQAVSTLVTAPVGPDGRVDLYVSKSAHLVVDVEGYVSAGSGLGYTTRTPSRLLDTRSQVTNRTLTVAAAGHGGVPSGAKAVVLDLTVQQTYKAGSVYATPAGSARQGTQSALWTASGQVRTGQVVVPVGRGGAVSLYVAGKARVTADVVGYYAPTGTQYGNGTPSRRLDAVLKARTVTHLPVRGLAGVPTGARSVVLAVHVLAPGSAGALTVYQDGAARYRYANLTWIKGGTGTALVTVPIGADGKVALYTSATAHISVNLVGSFR